MDKKIKVSIWVKEGYTQKDVEEAVKAGLASKDVQYAYIAVH